MSFNIPKAVIEKVEAAGGFHKKSHPESGSKGWVLVVEFIAQGQAVGKPQIQ